VVVVSSRKTMQFSSQTKRGRSAFGNLACIRILPATPGNFEFCEKAGVGLPQARYLAQELIFGSEKLPFFVAAQKTQGNLKSGYTNEGMKYMARLSFACYGYVCR
jgi:hypothetical protein